MRAMVAASFVMLLCGSANASWLCPEPQRGEQVIRTCDPNREGYNGNRRSGPEANNDVPGAPETPNAPGGPAIGGGPVAGGSGGAGGGCIGCSPTPTGGGGGGGGGGSGGDPGGGGGGGGGGTPGLGNPGNFKAVGRAGEKTNFNSGRRGKNN